VQNPLPVFVGVGGTPGSVVRAARLGLPLIIAIIGGQPRQFRPLAELYRTTWREAGHSAEKCFVGIHNIGFLADGAADAREAFWPAYRAAFGKIGRERGWPPPTRPQYDAQCGPLGALLVGDAATVAEKILAENEALGGIDRLSILIDNGALTHRQIMRAIEVLGTGVAPLVRAAATSGAQRA
jgi:alkanesulfonate monooxygenase SsuD/methylene tetrahydromethanopterin reductase-like flavin-dependent oxidoreductase (luciferase family)